MSSGLKHQTKFLEQELLVDLGLQKSRASQGQGSASLVCDMQSGAFERLYLGVVNGRL